MSNKTTLEKAQATLKEANDLQEQGNIEASIDIYRRAIKIKPNFAQPLIKLAQIYESQQNWEEVIVCYQRLIGLRPKSATFHLKLAEACKQQNQIYSAIAAYQTAIAIKPDLPARIYKDLGIFYSKKKKMMLPSLLKVIKKLPNNLPSFRRAFILGLPMR